MGLRQWDAGDPEGEDVRIASVGQLSVIFFANRALVHLSVLDIPVSSGRSNNPGRYLNASRVWQPGLEVEYARDDLEEAMLHSLAVPGVIPAG